MVLDPALARKVLTTNFRQFHDNEFSGMVDKKTDPVLGSNVFMLAGAEWKKKRAEILPAFTAARVSIENSSLVNR